MLFVLITILAKRKGVTELLSEYRGFRHFFEEAKRKKALLEYRL
jgi:hypothetical protein